MLIFKTTVDYPEDYRRQVYNDICVCCDTNTVMLLPHGVDLIAETDTTYMQPGLLRSRLKTIGDTATKPCTSKADRLKEFQEMVASIDWNALEAKATVAAPVKVKTAKKKRKR